MSADDTFAVLLERCSATKGRALVKVVCSVCDRAAADPTAVKRVQRLDSGPWINGRGEPLPSEHRDAGYVRTDDGQLLALEIRPGGRILSVR